VVRQLRFVLGAGENNDTQHHRRREVEFRAAHISAVAVIVAAIITDVVGVTTNRVDIDLQGGPTRDDLEATHRA